jgi:exonuclease SbcC
VSALLRGQEQAAQRKLARIRERIAALRQRSQECTQERHTLQQGIELEQRIALQERTVTQATEEVAHLTQLLKEREVPRDPLPDAAALAARAKAAQDAAQQAQVVLRRSREQILALERHLAGLEKELSLLAQAREEFVRVSAELAQLEQQAARTQELRSWLARQFTPLTTTIERHVLASIHGSFDAAVRKWFDRLVDDDGLSARLDHGFSPVLLQNGFETDVAHLSGGERTALSLAYRLALVHTIHVLSPGLATAGLIMLDEPTDGFSSEQLERVRDVLRELNMNQVILVSHEQQLEGFVDHIIRVHKTTDGSVADVRV